MHIVQYHLMFFARAAQLEVSAMRASYARAHAMRASAASAALTPGTASLTQSLRFFDRSTSAETSALPARRGEPTTSGVGRGHRRGLQGALSTARPCCPCLPSIHASMQSLWKTCAHGSRLGGVK